MITIQETFIRDFFPNGYNLFAIVCFDERQKNYYVQYGHNGKRFKLEKNALKCYDDYINHSYRVKEQHEKFLLIENDDDDSRLPF